MSQKLFRRVLLVGVILGGFFLHASANPIAVFYAFEADRTTLIKNAVELGTSKKVGGRSISKYRLGQRTIVVVKMGAGPVQTSTSASILLATTSCSLAISMGPVGAINNEIKIGDWLVIDKVTAYQKGIWEGTSFQLNSTSASPKVRLLPDELPKATIDQFLKTPRPATAASGEAFIASNVFRAKLREDTRADVVEMNLYGLESVCEDFTLPLLNLRVVSDYADANAQADFGKFVATYKGELGTAIAELIEAMPPDPADPDTYQNLRKLLGK